MKHLRAMYPKPLADRFRQYCEQDRDINHHLGILYGLAVQCDHITEFGLRGGVSTTALLMGQPRMLHLYDSDSNTKPTFELLKTMRGRTNLLYTVGDSRLIDMPPTDFLHIDTTHNYNCLSMELSKHSSKVSRWLAIHDTAIYGAKGDDGGEGLSKAIEELVSRGEWEIFAYWPNNNGMTILRRTKG